MLAHLLSHVYQGIYLLSDIILTHDAVCFVQTLQKMVPLARTRHITCPVCKKVCDLPAKKEDLPNNLFAMHIIVLNDQIKLNNERKNLL